MRKTFTTRMPDKAGAFRIASEIMTELNLNITRVSYNKAVDIHILFIEVEGQEAAINEATKRLYDVGYISDNMNIGNVILIEFTLKDVPGSVLPILKLISSYNFNISYMSSREEGGDVQHFRMGLMIENENDVSDFIKKASMLCELKILEYNKCEQVLDNTVFYLSFANQIAKDLCLNDDQKMELIINSNLIMEILRDSPKAQYKTFDYIQRFADRMRLYRADAFAPRISEYQINEDVTVSLIEPPCGSNVCIINCKGRLVFVDGGMRCYAQETIEAVKTIVKDFEKHDKYMILTHADVDHCGICDNFDKIYVSQDAFNNFVLEAEGKDNFREKNPLHSPYVKISKILSGYRTPDISHLIVIGENNSEGDALFGRIGVFELPGLSLEVFEGNGGHVAGEIVLIERKLHIIFTGDIFVNVKECDPRQRDFNKLAPYLMTSVDTDPELAKREREAVFQMLEKGEWLVIGGHGSVKSINV